MPASKLGPKGTRPRVRPATPGCRLKAPKVEGHGAWSTVGNYAGFLAIAVAVSAIAATWAFRSYQRAI